MLYTYNVVYRRHKTTDFKYCNLLSCGGLSIETYSDMNSYLTFQFENARN